MVTQAEPPEAGTDGREAKGKPPHPEDLRLQRAWLAAKAPHSMTRARLEGYCGVLQHKVYPYSVCVYVSYIL